jgi:hypothetical protein
MNLDPEEPLTLEDRHRESVGRKYDRIQGLHALWLTWERFPNLDPQYVAELEQKITVEKARMRHMKP